MHINPWALNHASQAWNDNSSTIPKKLLKTAAGAIYDIYIQNPYDIVVGNCKKLANVDKKIILITVATFGVLYGLMLYGTSFHLAGRCLQAIGLSNVGLVIKNLGTRLFVAGAVPIYGLFYALPKYIIKSIPAFAEYIVTKVSVCAEWIFRNLLEPMFSKVIEPISVAVYKVLSFVITKTADLVVYCAKPIFNFAKVICSKLLSLMSKIANVAEWIFDHTMKLVFPVLKAIGNAMYTVGSFLKDVCVELLQATAKVAYFIFKNVLSPVLKGIYFVLKTVGSFLKDVCTELIQAIAKVAHFIFKNILSHIFKEIYFILKTVGSFIKDVCAELIQATAKVAYFIFKNVLSPVLKAIYFVLKTAGSALLEYVIKPITYVLWTSAKAVGQIAKEIFDLIAPPVVNSITSIAKTCQNVTIEFINAGTEIWRGVFTRT